MPGRSGLPGTRPGTGPPPVLSGNWKHSFWYSSKRKTLEKQQRVEPEWTHGDTQLRPCDGERFHLLHEWGTSQGRSRRTSSVHCHSSTASWWAAAGSDWRSARSAHQSSSSHRERLWETTQREVSVTHWAVWNSACVVCLLSKLDKEQSNSRCCFRFSVVRKLKSISKSSLPIFFEKPFLYPAVSGTGHRLILRFPINIDTSCFVACPVRPAHSHGQADMLPSWQPGGVWQHVRKSWSWSEEKQLAPLRAGSWC